MLYHDFAMSKRLFVALLIPDDLRSTVENWQKSLAKMPVRLTPSQELHMTLVPPWQAFDASIALERFKLMTPPSGMIPAVFHSIDIGPNKNNPRLIWAVGPPDNNLNKLADAAKRWFGQRGVGAEILPHLTLARFNPEALDSIPQARFPESIGWSGLVSTIALMESDLRPEGAKYTVLASCSFS